MIAELFSVRDMSVLVTGAASGIGLEIATCLARAGARVTLSDIDGTNLEVATGRLTAEGLTVISDRCDISERDEVYALVDRVVARNGCIDVVFANAGSTAGPSFQAAVEGQLGGSVRDSWEASMRLNLTGAFDTISAVAPHMKVARTGSIVVTTSISALKLSPVSAYAYIAAKGGLNAIVRQAAIELAPFNVRINAIAPGFVRTNIAGGKLKTNVAAIETLTRQIPMARLGETSDLLGLAVLLASPASAYMSGTIIPVDGGVCVS